MVVNTSISGAKPALVRPVPAAAALTPKEVFGILRRHILLMVTMTILGLITGGTLWYLLRRYYPKYTAQTFIEVLPPIERDPMIIGGAQVAKDIQYGHRLSMAALIRQQSTLQRLVERDKVQETQWFKSFGEIKDRAMKKAVKRLRRKDLSASAQRDGDYIVLSMRSGNKEEAALIVNEMVDLFLGLQGVTKKEDISNKLTKLGERRTVVDGELRAAEQALDDVRERFGFADLELHNWRDTMQVRIDSLTIEENNIALELAQMQAAIESLQRLATGPVTVQVEHQIERDPIMLALAQRHTLLESSLAARLTKFGENHKLVRETQEMMKEIQKERELRKAAIANQTRQANLRNAQDRLVTLQNQLEQLQTFRQEAAAIKRNFDLARVQYDQRVRIRDERKQILDSIKQQIEKLRIVHDDPETPKVQFVGYAPVPLEVSSPKLKLYVPGGTMLGLMAGVGLAFLIELLNDLVRTPRDVGRYLHIPLLCVIPDSSEDKQLRDVELCLAVRQAPYSIISECYRRLRTNFKLSSTAESSKVLLISSGAAGDGKTSVAVNFATTFIAEDKKVLVIDTNFRRPILHTIFPKEKGETETDKQSELGLSNLLMGQCSYHDVIRTSGIEGLDVIDAGPIPSNPVELLGTVRMKELIQEQRKNYDYVIVDSPPVLVVSDAKVLAKLVDGTILVFNAAATRRGAAIRTIRELKGINATIVGCVLLGVRAMKGGYFQEQFRSYQEYQKLQLARIAQLG
jgi:capsular exopolysaccharide synthesis family protein